ncbi:MAG: DNA polymerase III subunit delta [Hyphomicrobiales bacterium]|nr:DNA polymerase III subunit delta [Hyphomicrobiales bacterium]
MANLAPGQLDTFLEQRKAPGGAVFLLHGVNEALRLACFDAIRRAARVDQGDAFAYVRLDDAALEADAGRLADEVKAVSMFGDLRLIDVRCAARAAQNVVRLALESIDESCLVVVSTGELPDGFSAAGTKKSTPALIAIACPAERAGDLRTLVQDQLRAHDLAIGDDALTLLLDLSGGDRAAIAGEVEKLSAYKAKDKTPVSVEDVAEVVADVSALLTDQLVRAAYAGDMGTFLTLLDRLGPHGSERIAALMLTASNVQFAHRAKMQRWSSGRNDPWKPEDLRVMMRMLARATLQGRQESRASELLAERALLTLAQRAGRRR